MSDYDNDWLRLGTEIAVGLRERFDQLELVLPQLGRGQCQIQSTMRVSNRWVSNNAFRNTIKNHCSYPTRFEIRMEAACSAYDSNSLISLRPHTHAAAYMYLGARRHEQQVFERAHADEPDARGRHARNDDKERDNLGAQLLVASAEAGLKQLEQQFVQRAQQGRVVGKAHSGANQSAFGRFGAGADRGAKCRGQCGGW